MVFVFTSKAPRPNRDVKKIFDGRGGKIRGVLGLVTGCKLQVQAVLFPGTEPLLDIENVTELLVTMPTNLNYCEVLHTINFRIASTSFTSQQYIFLIKSLLHVSVRHCIILRENFVSLTQNYLHF